MTGNAAGQRHQRPALPQAIAAAGYRRPPAYAARKNAILLRVTFRSA